MSKQAYMYADDFSRYLWKKRYGLREIQGVAFFSSKHYMKSATKSVRSKFPALIVRSVTIPKSLVYEVRYLLMVSCPLPEGLSEFVQALPGREE